MKLRILSMMLVAPAVAAQEGVSAAVDVGVHSRSRNDILWSALGCTSEPGRVARLRLKS